MKTRIFNLIIIDESGSMWSIKKEAINSVNETIQTIRAAQKKHEEQVHYISLVTFNDDVKTIYDCVRADEVKELTADTYLPDCCTALYDAMGISLNALRKNVAENDKVLVTIVTDGYENASKEYNGKAIKALVDELKAKNWIFAYIGANQDVEKVAATIGTSAFENCIGLKDVQLSNNLTIAFCLIPDSVETSCFFVLMPFFKITFFLLLEGNLFTFPR